MGIPLIQQLIVGAYILRKMIGGNSRFPLVLMLEPLFRCNLSCAGCGKIEFPEKILDRRLSVEECINAAEECGAPVVSIAGGEPLIHPDIDAIVNGLIARRKFVYLCTNALLLKRKMDVFQPSSYLTFNIHLDGLRERHDRMACRDGIFDSAVEAIRLVKDRGFRVTTNTTLFDGESAEEASEFFDFVTGLGVEGMTISPAFVYEKAPDQEHFLKREATKALFSDVFRIGQRKPWRFNHSSLYLDFLAGNQAYRCTPWGNPTRNIFGWQKPCYLLDDGHVETFRELMHGTSWGNYGHDRNPRCRHCMVHCGYEPTAVIDTVRHPLKALKVKLSGVRAARRTGEKDGNAHPTSVPQRETVSAIKRKAAE